MKHDNHIHWYPGHMAVATKEINRNLKLVDMIIELVDARAPISSRHPFLARYDGPKSHLIVMTKIDMADHAATTGWEVFFKERGLTMLALDLFDNKSPDIILATALEMNKALHQRQIAKGMKPQPIRAMVIGIPNVGKSTLINRLSSRQATVVSDRPGVTRAPQWIKPNNKIWLLDTPGVLPMNYEIPLMSLHLASIGAIKRDILPLDTIGKFLFDYIKRNYPRLLDRYVDHQVAPSYESFLILVANRFGLFDQGVPDIDKAIARFYDDFKSGKIGRISLEVAF